MTWSLLFGPLELLLLVSVWFGKSLCTCSRTTTINLQCNPISEVWKGSSVSSLTPTFFGEGREVVSKCPSAEQTLKMYIWSFWLLKMHFSALFAGRNSGKMRIFGENISSLSVCSMKMNTLCVLHMNFGYVIYIYLHFNLWRIINLLGLERYLVQVNNDKFSSWVHVWTLKMSGFELLAKNFKVNGQKVVKLEVFLMGKAWWKFKTTGL